MASPLGRLCQRPPQPFVPRLQKRSLSPSREKLRESTPSVNHFSLSQPRLLPRDALRNSIRPPGNKHFHPIFGECYLGLVLAGQAGDPGAHGRLRRRLGVTLCLGTGCEWSVTVLRLCCCRVQPLQNPAEHCPRILAGQIRTTYKLINATAQEMNRECKS